jgi:hypothetical protein
MIRGGVTVGYYFLSSSFCFPLSNYSSEVNRIPTHVLHDK